MPPIHLNPHPVVPKKESYILIDSFIATVPFEGLAIFIASLSIRVFSESLFSPLFGLGISIIATRLVLKTLACYDDVFLNSLIKEACKFNKQYPNLQLITFISALALGFLSSSLSLFVGIGLGVFSAIMLDVEKYKQMQAACRKLQIAVS